MAVVVIKKWVFFVKGVSLLLFIYTIWILKDCHLEKQFDFLFQRVEIIPILRIPIVQMHFLMGYQIKSSYYLHVVIFTVFRGCTGRKEN